MYRAEERYHLTASGPALLQAVLARIKAAEEQLSISRYASLCVTITPSHIPQVLAFEMFPHTKSFVPQPCSTEVNAVVGRLWSQGLSNVFS